MKTPEEARAILAALERQHPGAQTELAYADAFELLVATILSAQTTDVRVNEVTPHLFRRFPDARALASADAGEVERLVQATGFFRQKTRALLGMARTLVDEHEGAVPASMESLVRLPGVGRKTASVVLGHALGVPALAVDRHVLRVTNRIGLAKSDDPEAVERQLTAALPPGSWTLASDTLILHGRRVCKPRPLCDRCSVRDSCEFFRQGLGAGRPGAKPRARKRTPLPAAAGKKETRGTPGGGRRR